MIMYVAYEDGVYRHKTVAFGEELADSTSEILDYFKNTDDYHVVNVECLDTYAKEITAVCTYHQTITYRHYEKLSGYRGRMRVIDGKCVVYKDGEVFHEYIKSHKLKDDGVWCDR